MQKNKTFLIMLILGLILTMPSISAAHWIAGYAENAADTTSPDGRIVRLWNPSNSEEIFTTIGALGPSATPNVYMIDCELLTTPCVVGDKLNLTVQNDASGYNAKNIVQITITGAGFDTAPNLTIDTPPMFTSLKVEDTITSPQNEIDLTPATQTKVTCLGVIEDLEGATSISKIHAEFYGPLSSFGSPNDNNNHYTNTTCQINTSYGNSNQAQVNCTFQIEYYSQPNLWTCKINATDNYSASTLAEDTTNINTLLALGVNSPMQFGEVNTLEVSQEIPVNVTNYGNIPINLSLQGYGSAPFDGNSMECGSSDIPIYYTKFNLTTPNSGNLTLTQFETLYKNLTSTPTTETFNLNSRQDDLSNDATSNTYWRIYLPAGIGNMCTGNIVFGATQS